jgi:hypothetical protein
MDIHDTFSKVRGRDRMNDRIIPTMPNTMVQVPWSETVFNMTEKVRI